jgi:predicted phage terminase large subunit-like protein
LAEAVERLIVGETERLMVFMPPQHGKTELVSRRLPAYLFGRNPDTRVIACSHTDDFAGSINRDVQRVIGADEYRVLFPGTRLNERAVKGSAFGQYRRTTDFFEIVGHTGYYRSAGVGGNVTGRGFSFGIIDDPIKSREQADSSASRQRIWEWYANDFITRAGPKARVLLTHTRWHRDDLAGRILLKMAEESGEQWTILNLPALATDTPTHPDDPRKPGEALWPAFKSRDELLRLQSLDPRAFASLYQQDPRPEGGAEWPGEWFGPQIWFDQWPTGGRKIAALDPSKGKSDKWGDYSAFIKLQYVGGVLYVDADMANDRNVSVITDTAVELQRTWQSEAFGVETNQFQELLAGNIAEASRVHDVPFPLYSIDNRVNKLVRIRRLTPFLSQGIMRFKGGSRGAQLLVQQLQDFPNGDHDDGPDALEMAVRLLIETAGGQVDDGLGSNILQAIG